MVEKNYFSDYTDEEEKTEEENKNFFSDYTVEDDIETEDAPKEENYFSDYADENAVDSEEPKKEDTTSVFTPPKEKLTYEQFKQSPELVAAAMRFSKNRLGYDTISEEDAIDETIEHFRQFKVNELTAGKDWGYTSALAADGNRDEINDYKSLYRATDSLEDFSGGVLNTLGDYAGGILTAPSTLAGLLLPGGGKLSGVAAQQLAKLGVGRAISSLASNPIKTIAATEATGAIAQDVSAQKSLMAVEEQDDYDFGQTIVSGIVAGGGSALVSSIPLYYAKRFASKGFSAKMQTDDLLEKSTKAAEAKVVKADEAAKETIESKSTQAGDVKEWLKSLNEENVAAGKATMKDVANKQGVDVPLRVAVTPDKLDRVIAASVDLLELGGGLKTFDRLNKKGEVIGKQTERITEAISRVIKDNTEGASEEVSEALAKDFGKTLDKYSLTTDDFANVFMSEFSEAARLLQKGGEAKKTLKNLMNAMDNTAFSDIFSLNDDVVKVIKKSKDAMQNDGKEGFLKVFDNGAVIGSLRNLDALRLASMTSQVGTTVRNTVGGYTRVGFDVLNQAFDEGIQRSVSLLKGEKITKTGSESFRDIFSVAYGLINKEQSIAVESIFAMGFQNKAQKLFRQLADLEDLTGVGFKGKKQPPSKLSNITTTVGRNLNVLNTLSDNMFKRAAFMGGLTRELSKLKRVKISSGKTVNDLDYDLVDIMKTGRFNEVFGSKGGQKALDRAIEESLYFTYQASPKSPLGNLLIQGANKLPFLTTSVVPFPRFLANAMRFTYEYSPIYLLTSGKVRKELARTAGKEGEEFGIRTYTETAKGLTGLAFLFGAQAYRNSEYAGEKWYEGQSSEGNPYSLLPFFPAAPYLFFGDLIARARKGEDVIDRKTFKETMQAVTGMQMGKAGFGLYAMDKLVDDIGNIFEGQDSDAAYYAVKKVGSEFASNIISTYTMPITPIQDTYNTFLAPDDERIIRDNNIEDLSSLIIAKSLARIPGNYAIEKMLKEAYGTEYEIPKAYQSPTRKGLLRRITPITRQVEGKLYGEKKTDIEKELDRLKITRSDVMKRTGIPEADELLGWYMGEVMIDIIQPFIKSKLYKSLPEQVKKVRLKEEIVRVRKSVVDQAKNTIVTTNSNKNTKPMTRVRFLKLPKIYRKIALDTYNERLGEPTSLKDYDYEILYSIAKELKKGRLKNIKFESVDIIDELNEEDETLDSIKE
tara:strand:+ start:3095 stop:6724 length:3630 start_codon:yes stop_codon:yes gene_type:complete